jgi:glycosyltransferase involved in cell wall biosynthesis
MWKVLEQPQFEDYEYPKVSIIIPTLDCDEKISLTLDSIVSQHYPDLEVFIIDAGSKDRTLEVVKSYRDNRIFPISVSEYQRYLMLNSGISHASGTYLNFLFPGDYYSNQETLKIMMNLALSHKMPHLVYCGSLIRPPSEDPRTLYRPFKFRVLARGKQPTSLQSCWFHAKTFEEVGKFNVSYQMRGGYDLMCRIAFRKDLRIASTNRVLTDYDLRQIRRRDVLTHFEETWRIVVRYFGYFRAVRWLLTQKDFTRILNLSLRNLKVAFLGRR